MSNVANAEEQLKRSQDPTTFDCLHWPWQKLDPKPRTMGEDEQ